MTQERNEEVGNSTPVVPPEVEEGPTIGVPADDEGDLAKSEVILGVEQLRFAEIQEQYVRHYVMLADTKAGFAFGIASLVAITLFSDATLISKITHSDWNAAAAFGLVSLLLLLVSCWFAFNVIAPRTSKPSEDLFSFVSVSKKDSADDYTRDLAAADLEALSMARVKHCYDTSVVCMHKFDNLNKAIWFGVPGLVMALLTVLAK